MASPAPPTITLTKEDVAAIATAAAAAALAAAHPGAPSTALDEKRKAWLASVAPFEDAMQLGCRAPDEYEFKAHTMRVRDGGTSRLGGYSLVIGRTPDGKPRVVVGPCAVPVSMSLREARRHVARLQGPHAERIVATCAALDRKYSDERAAFARGDRPHPPAEIDWEAEPNVSAIDPKHAW